MPPATSARRSRHRPEHERRRRLRPGQTDQCQPLSRSATKTAWVVRLKPKRCSEHERPPDGEWQSSQAHRQQARQQHVQRSRSRAGMRRPSRREPDRGQRCRRQGSGPAGRARRRPVRPCRSAACDRVIGGLRVLRGLTMTGEGGLALRCGACPTMASLPERQPELHDRCNARAARKATVIQ